LFEAPAIFDIIQKASGSDMKEMYQVFNMGHRLELFSSEKGAEAMIRTSAAFGIEGRVVGRVEAANQKQLVIKNDGTEIVY
jgi:phosphoribosylformylglycinamidine cyclo-ligase